MTIRVKNILKYEHKSMLHKMLILILVAGVYICLITNPVINSYVDDISKPFDIDKAVVNNMFENSSILDDNSDFDGSNPSYSNPVSQDIITKDFDITEWENYHNGIDILTNEGEPIKAVASGRVIYAGSDEKYGNIIKVNHGRGYEVWYGGCGDINVTKNQIIKKDEIIATAGNTGTGSHLHFSIVFENKFVDPKDYIRFK